ncbi:MAG: glucose-6-phosphate isomerase [Alphaproteobacteria bacterium]|nr:MAG: glucose-6-phosphate isomerase [Alphaproteobacteria bacterium]
MLYEIYLENIFNAKNDINLEHYNKAVKEVLSGLYKDLKTGSKKRQFLNSYLQLPGERKDLTDIRATADRILKKFSDVVVLGTGGSSLGAQMLVALMGQKIQVPNGGARLHFSDNLGPHTMQQLFNELDLSKTHFLVISKSGGTAETIAQMLACFSNILTLVGEKNIREYFTIIVQPGKSFLHDFAKKWHLPIHYHDPNLGGRFSVLSVVGLLPAMIAGLDVVALREGAAQILQQTINADNICDVGPAIGAIAAYELQKNNNININVMMPYECRLKSFSAWYKQLWAESLGKDGKGTTPLDALGPVDQHSQLQLFLDGPNDKYFTIITTSSMGTGPTIDSMLIHDDEYSYMAGCTIGDMVEAEAISTIEALRQRGKPVRHIRIQELNERSLGALIMHFILETIISAHLMGVDPHDQPSVEYGKKLTKEYLADLRTIKSSNASTKLKFENLTIDCSNSNKHEGKNT